MLGVKHSKKPHTLGTKLSRTVVGLGNRVLPYSNVSASNIATGIKNIAGLGINNLLHNESNSDDVRYMPTGIKHYPGMKHSKSYLEKK